MEIFMVGVFKKGKDITGFRMVSVGDGSDIQVKDVTYNQALSVLQSGLASIHNLKVEKGKLKGSNGSLDRYGIVGKSQALVILKELHDNNDKFYGYMCSDTNGNVKGFSEQTTMQYAETLGIANGKVVPNANGEKHLSCIEGTYPIKKVDYKPNAQKQQETKVQTQAQVPTTQAQVEQTKQNQQLQPTETKVQAQAKNDDTQTQSDLDFYDKAIKLITECKKYSKYYKDFAFKIGASVEKYKKCSEKQFNILKKEYEELTGFKADDFLRGAIAVEKVQDKLSANSSDASVKVKDEHSESEDKTSESEKQQEVKVDDTKETKNDTKEQPKKLREYVPLVIAKPAIDMDDILVYQLMREGNIYVKGIKDDKRDTETLYIPETTVLNGKEHKITGILQGAFENTRIINVKTSKNINDIGIGAFRNCYKLKGVDLSESKHQHIPSNCFRGCSSLEQVEVGNQVQRIHEDAFHGCKKLKMIRLPECTDTIAREAFLECHSLESVQHKAKRINDSAFKECIKLDTFDFSSVLSIGTAAFRYTGFKELTIPGNVTTVGNKAFADCYALSNVVIEEGVQELGEYCFAKGSWRKLRSEIPLVDESQYTELKEITTAKSIVSVLADAFRHVGLVKVWTGSVCESHCKGYNVPYVQIDATSLENSTKTRVKSEMLDINPIETLWDVLSNPSVGESNPTYELNTTKFANIPFTEQMYTFFKLNKTTEQVEPHIKFKAAVNYLQNVTPLYTEPLSKSILRLQDTFYTDCETIYDDGCNRIYKVIYRIMDTLEEGAFNMVIMDNKLQYLTEFNVYTDMEMENTQETDDAIPVSKFLHAGDTIGKAGTVSGYPTIITDKETLRRINVGEKLLERLNNHGITFKLTKRDSILYIPACNCALKLHDGRIWDRPGVISRESKDCINLIGIMTYDEMVAELIKAKRTSGNTSKLFDTLKIMSDAEVARRVRDIGIIEDEKEAQLFQVSKQFRDVIGNARLNSVDITPNLITPEVFMELSRSYWMVHKDENWLRQAGNRSLNKTNEYTIGKYKLIEYKSNQVVKFSNPYMNGQKGAYVFTLMQNRNIVGVYASRYDMNILVHKIYDLTDINKYQGEEIPVLMQDARKLDKVDPKLFYTFYDVLESKNGWNFNSYLNYSRYGYGYGAAFHISMYKPTGVFYLTLSRTEEVKTKDAKGKEEKSIRARVIIPILPIGNMDRALMVATTTNTNAKDTQLLKELLGIMLIEEMDNNGLRVYGVNKDEFRQYRENYFKARELVVARCKDVAKYKELIDDRAVYMLGTIHEGKLQREKDCISYDDDELAIDDIDMSDLNIDEPDADIDDYSIDDIDESELDDEEISLDDDDNDDDLSFEEFFATAKQMGITDEAQARAMYISFKNQQ